MNAFPLPRDKHDPVVWDASILRKTRIPRYGAALLEALNFGGGSRSKLLCTLNETEWRCLLDLCDGSQLTLLFGQICRQAVPDWVRNRIDRDYLDHCARFERLQAAALEIADLFTTRSIEFRFLKGFSHSPDLAPNPRLRAQRDIDLWCRPTQIQSAKNALLDLGYRPTGRSKRRHLDPMVRETEWNWTGDYFARDLPIPVELHYKLWDDEMEGIPGPEEEEVWNRRCFVPVDNAFVPVLDATDRVAFAALHMMTHLLHGDIRLQTIWELAYVLHTRAVDDRFWSQWQSSQAAARRRAQTVAFLLADYWFGCGLPDPIREEADLLTPDICRWIRHYGLSPIEALFAPNKHELWLHLCLVDAFADRARILFRRLLPIGAAKWTVRATNTRENEQMTRILRRAAHHARTMPAFCVHGLRWWWLCQGRR